MGFSHSAYHFYGLHIPEDRFDRQVWDEVERLDEIIHSLGDAAPNVGHLTAGKFDQDMLFLVARRKTENIEIQLGQFRMVSQMNVRDLGWDSQLLVVSEAAGYAHLGQPGWITVPDIS